MAIQTLLMHVEPFKEKRYESFSDLLVSELEIEFNNYEEHQLNKLDYLITKDIIYLDEKGHIQVNDWDKLLILRDIYENEVASFHHYPHDIQRKVLEMCEDDMLYLESSLLSKPEQQFFNYYLNKSEFTNGLDLRNSYLHGTQADPTKTEFHEDSYMIYMKLLILIIFKIEDDLSVHNKLLQKTV